MGMTIGRVCAFAAYEAITLGFIGGAMSSSSLWGAILLLSYLVGVAGGLVLARFVSARPMKDPRFSDQMALPCLAAFLSAVGIVLRIVYPDLDFGVCLIVLYVLAASVGMLLTFSSLRCLDSVRPSDENALRGISYAPALLGMVFAFILYWSIEPIRTAAFSVLPFFVVCLFVSKKLFPWQPIERTESDREASSRLQLSSRTNVLLFTFMVALGLCLSQLERPSDPSVFSAIGAITVVLIAFVWFSSGRFAITPASYHALLLPASIALLVVLAMFGGLAGQIVACIAVPFTCLQTATNSYFLIKNAYLYGLRMDVHFAYGRTSPTAGLCIGLIIGIVCMRLPGFLGIETLRAAAALIAVVVCAAFAFTHGAQYVVVKDGMLEYSQDGEGMYAKGGVSWENEMRRRSEQLSMQYSLTPRESEILVLLARGYNSTTISRLLYISPQTVKTHSYRIYQKMGLHSQQDLILLLDDKYEPGQQKDAEDGD